MKTVLTADLCDAFRDEADALGADFRVLPPVFRSFGGRRRFHGPVQTLRCFEDNGLLRAAVSAPGTVATADGPVGAVLVVDGGASLRRALLGGNLGVLAVASGWAGVLIDGCVRDCAELAALDLGILALAPMPMPGVKRPDAAPVGERDRPVRVQGVAVRPGDWLYADEDGVVIAATRL